MPSSATTWDQVFVRDLELGITEMASVDSLGSEGNATSSGPTSISDDGGRVAFRSSASNLVPNDTNVVYDIYVHETGGACQLGTNPDDIDCDGVDDSIDNCVGVNNPSQYGRDGACQR